ncbi:MAG: phage portal protein [Thermomicrobiales bacterium]
MATETTNDTITAYLPDVETPQASRDAMQWALDEFRGSRQGTYFGFYKYIEGDQPLAFATEKFKSAFGRSFDAFRANRLVGVVGAITDRLSIVGWGGDDDGEEAQDAKDLWDENDMQERELQVYDEAATAGDAYAIVEKHPDTGEVHIWPQTAVQCRVHYSQDRPGEVEYGVRQWVESDRYARLNIYFGDRIEKYRSNSAMPDGTDLRDWARETNAASLAGRFLPYQPEGDSAWPVMLPGDGTTVPVFHFAANGTVNSYGISELENLIPVQDAFNKTLMDLLVAMEFAAFPQRYLLNADTAGSREAIKRYQAGVERLINIKAAIDDSGVTLPVGAGEFSAADVQQYIDPIELFDRLISRLSKVPEHYLRGDEGSDQMSGRSRRLKEAPFVAKLEKYQKKFGPVWLRLMIYALSLEGKQADRKSLRVIWRPAAPMAKEDLLDVAMVEKTLGLSLRTILRETMGLDKEQIDTYLEEITEEQDEKAARFNAGLGPGLSPFGPAPGQPATGPRPAQGQPGQKPPAPDLRVRQQDRTDPRREQRQARSTA